MTNLIDKVRTRPDRNKILNEQMVGKLRWFPAYRKQLRVDAMSPYVPNQQLVEINYETIENHYVSANYDPVAEEIIVRQMEAHRQQEE